MRDDFEAGWEEYETQMHDHFDSTLEEITSLFDAVDAILRGGSLSDLPLGV
jgi:hypothetical protein